MMNALDFIDNLSDEQFEHLVNSAPDCPPGKSKETCDKQCTVCWFEYGIFADITQKQR